MCADMKDLITCNHEWIVFFNWVMLLANYVATEIMNGSRADDIIQKNVMKNGMDDEKKILIFK